MKTTEQLIEDLSDLRAKLEAMSPGCTTNCPPRDGFTLDAILAEENALLAVQSALESSKAVNARGAAVAAKYGPAQSAATTTKLTPTQRIAAAGGVKACKIKGEITRLEALLPGTTGKTKAVLESKLTNLRSELSSLTAGK